MTRVLLVEDNFADALLLTELLEAEGTVWTVVHVETFAEATAHWAQGPFDALLLDLDIPDGFGLDLLGRALALAGTAPVVVLSGLANDELAHAATLRGARAYVVKGHTVVPSLITALGQG